MNPENDLRRREFLAPVRHRRSERLRLPTIIPSRVFGADAPSKKIHVGQIGCGRIANDMDLPGFSSMTSRELWPSAIWIRTGSGWRRSAWKNSTPRKTGSHTRQRQNLWRLPRAAQRSGNRRRCHQHAGPLARRTDHRRSSGRQRYLCAETAVDDARRRPRGERHRARQEAHFPDRQPAALGSALAAIPPWGRTGAQRPHRQTPHRQNRPADGPRGRRGTGNAGAREPQLRHVAGLHPAGPTPKSGCIRRTASATGPAGCGSNPTAWA